MVGGRVCMKRIMVLTVHPRWFFSFFLSSFVCWGSFCVIDHHMAFGRAAIFIFSNLFLWISISIYEIIYFFFLPSFQYSWLSVRALHVVTFHLSFVKHAVPGACYVFFQGAGPLPWTNPRTIRFHLPTYLARHEMVIPRQAHGCLLGCWVCLFER